MRPTSDIYPPITCEMVFPTGGQPARDPLGALRSAAPLDPQSGVGNSARIRKTLSLAPTPHAPGKAKHPCHPPQQTQGEGQPKIRRRRARDPSGALRSAAPLDPKSGVENSARIRKKISLAPTPHAPGKGKHPCHSPQQTQAQGEGQPKIRRRRARGTLRGL